MKTSKFGLYTIAFLFFFYSAFIVLIHAFYSTNDSNLFNYYTDSYGIIAGVGGLIGYTISFKWGGFNSKVGRAVQAFSIGLLLQFLGQLSYGYYRYISKIDVPYPSFGDFFYLLSIPVYIYASWLIAYISGVKVKFRESKYKFLCMLVLAVCFYSAYLLILSSHDFSDNDPIIILLEIGYPIGQAVFLSLSIISLILSRNILGGIMKPVLNLILIALIFQYIADLYFTYEVIHEALYAGGISDYIYVIAYTVMAIAIYKFGEVPAHIGTSKLKKK